MSLGLKGGSLPTEAPEKPHTRKYRQPAMKECDYVYTYVCIYERSSDLIYTDYALLSPFHQSIVWGSAVLYDDSAQKGPEQKK